MTVLLAASFTGSAQAAGESIYITPPTGAKVGASYSFTVSGYAPQTEQLYFFDDVESCGPSPYVEHAVHNANGDDYTVNGNFQYVSGGWTSPKATTYYVCAYLVDASEPPNPSGGVLAESFQNFAVHSATDALDKRCANVTFVSPYTHKTGRARVAVRQGSVSCARARGLIKKALEQRKNGTAIGLVWYWSVGSWRCSSGGDGSLTVCTRSGRKVEATTPLPSGYWAQP